MNVGDVKGNEGRGEGEVRGGREGGSAMPDLTLPRGTRGKVSKVSELDPPKCPASPHPQPLHPLPVSHN